MHSKSTSQLASTFTDKLANCPIDLRMFMGMGIAKKNRENYATAPKGFTAEVYSLSVEVSNKQEPQVVITEVNMGSYAGKAWDVVISAFDVAKSYIAQFTDDKDAKKGKLDFSAVETDGDVAFAVLLHTSRAKVALNISVE